MKIVSANVTGSFILNGVDVTDTLGSSSLWSGSFSTRTSNLELFSGSINSYTASNNTNISNINATTASLNSYTASNNTNIGNINTTTASLNTFSGSASSRLSSLEVTSGSNITRLSSIESTTGSLNAASGSAITRLNALEVTSGSNITRISALESASGSAITRLNSIESTTGSLNAASGSAITRLSALEVTSGSNISRLSSLESKTGSYATTGSNTFVDTQYISASNNAIGFTSTSSLYTDGGLRVAKDAYISGTLYLNNVTVYGTQSVCFITSSQLNISSNLISVNTSTPSVRFGGLAVYDSGSTGLTGSILWDSENNHWVYSNPSGSSYSGGMFISGPRTATLGSEVGTTACMLLAGQGGDHLTSSAIYHDTTVTCIPNTLIGSTICSTMTNASCIGIGTTSPAGTLHAISTATFQGIFNRVGGSAGNITFRSARGTVSSLTASNPGDIIFQNSYAGYDGTNFQNAGMISVGLDSSGTICATSMPGYLRFSTTPNGSVTVTERLRITSDGIACFACQVCAPSFVSTGIICAANSISGKSATSNSGSPAAVIGYSGDDSSTIWRGAFVLQHNTDVPISTGSSIGITFSPIASCNSNFYGHAAIKAVRENATTDNQNTALAFWTRAGASNSTTDSEKMRITSGGNVGIGTTSPLTQLHVNDGVNVSNLTMLTLSQLGNTGDRDVVNLKLSFNNGNTPGVMMSAIKNSSAGSDLSLSTGLNSNGALCERIRITSVGCVGFGATAPTGTIHICGADLAMRIQSTSCGNLQMGQWVAGENRIQSSARDLTLYQSDSCNVKVFTSATERLNITGTGIACFACQVCAPFMYVGRAQSGDTTDYGLFISRHGDISCSHAYTKTSALQINEFSNSGPTTVDVAGIFQMGFGRFAQTMTCAKNATLVHISYDGAMGPLRIDGRGNMFIGYDRTAQNTSDATFSLLVACGIAAGSYQYCVPPNGGALFSGNVGIGTTSTNVTGFGGGKVITLQADIQPVLELIGSTYNATGVFGGGAVHFRNTSTSVGTLGVENLTGNQGNMVFYTNNGTTWAERMRITSGGNVGIGISSPKSTLDVATTTSGTDVASTLTISAITNAAYGQCAIIQAFVNDSGNGECANIGSIHFLKQRPAGNCIGGDLIFSTRTPAATSMSSPTERMRITSVGNVGISCNNPRARFVVGGSVNASSFMGTYGNNLACGGCTGLFCWQADEAGFVGTLYIVGQGSGVNYSAVYDIISIYEGVCINRRYCMSRGVGEVINVNGFGTNTYAKILCISQTNSVNAGFAVASTFVGASSNLTYLCAF